MRMPVSRLTIKAIAVAQWSTSVPTSLRGGLSVRSPVCAGVCPELRGRVAGPAVSPSRAAISAIHSPSPVAQYQPGRAAFWIINEIRKLLTMKRVDLPEVVQPNYAITRIGRHSRCPYEFLLILNPSKWNQVLDCEEEFRNFFAYVPRDLSYRCNCEPSLIIVANS